MGTLRRWLSAALMVAAAACQPEPLDPTSLEKFVDEVPRPGVLSPKGHKHGATYYEVRMREAQQKLHRDLPPTTIWGYEGLYPGPTIEARQGEKVAVKWINQLPEQHLLPVDTTVHGTDMGEPEVRTVVHLHGGQTLPQFDGHPEAWFTRNWAVTGAHFASKVFEYPNEQPSATLWYHDHALGITRLNVYAGLAGFYLIRGHDERRARLPHGQYEIPLAIQDRSFMSDGSLAYPADEVNGVVPSIVPEFFGNVALVNGKIWPVLEVEATQYRLRLLNGSNARFYNLQLVQADSSGTPILDGQGNFIPGPTFDQIGSDGGLLPERVTIQGRLLMAPAERADTIVNFAGRRGQYFLLHNNAKTPFKSLDQTTDEVPLPEIMLIKVKDAPARSTTPRTTRLPKLERLDEQCVEQTRDITLEEGTDEHGRLKLLLNGVGWDDPATELPQLGATEIWRLINLTVDAHPIHLHGVFFQILDRRPFDVEHYLNTKEVVFTGPATAPAPNERGWKDTMRANPGEVSRVIVRFEIPGDFVYHCHILEHEDHEMMRPFVVQDGPTLTSQACNKQQLMPTTVELPFSLP